MTDSGSPSLARSAAPGPRIVYVVDDESRVRMALVRMLETIGYAPWPFLGGADLLAVLDELEAGCILLDFQMPGLSGTEVLERIARVGCEWPVIMMTAHADVPLAVRAMKLGAIEFVEKPFLAETLRPLIDVGFARLDEARAAHDLREDAADRLAALTPRERSVLDGLMAGHQNKTVAYRLGLSVRTVEMHRSNLLRKLGLRAVQEASVLLARAGISTAVA